MALRQCWPPVGGQRAGAPWKQPERLPNASLNAATHPEQAGTSSKRPQSANPRNVPKRRTQCGTMLGALPQNLNPHRGDPNHVPRQNHLRQARPQQRRPQCADRHHPDALRHGPPNHSRAHRRAQRPYRISASRHHRPDGLPPPLHGLLAGNAYPLRLHLYRLYVQPRTGADRPKAHAECPERLPPRGSRAGR